jgi:hypothetical protein
MRKMRSLVCATAVLLLVRCGGVGVGDTGPALGSATAASSGGVNVALGKPVTLSGGSFFTGGWGGGQMVAAGTLTDGVFVPRSTQWDQGPIWWDARDGVTRYLTVDLGGRFWLDSLILQGDDNDQYRVSARDPNGTWMQVWVAPATGGWGMQTRPNSGDNTASYALPAPVLADQLRVENDPYTDGYMSVSELQAFGRPVDAVVWLKLDGDARNSVPGGMDALSTGITYGQGRINQAAELGSSASGLSLPAIPGLGGTGITVSVWVRPDQYDRSQTVANQWDPRSNNNSWYLGIRKERGDGFWVWRVAFPGQPDREVLAPAAPVVLIGGHQPQGDWTHLAATYDGQAMKLYVNGELAAVTSGLTGGLPVSPLSINLGTRPNGSRFRGSLDDFRLWPSALPADEIAKIAREAWPGARSYANSDDWLAEHHRDLRYLSPTVLALNFVTGIDGGSQVNGVASGLIEGSRYHAYQATDGGTVEVALRPNIHLVDLSGTLCSAPGGGEYGGGPKCASTWNAEAEHNGSCFPRRPECTDSNSCGDAGTVAYAKLFSQEYAELYGIRDSSGRALPLCELIKSGRVHEVWLVGAVPNSGCDVKGAEVVEEKPRYGADGRKIVPWDPEWHAGNESYDSFYNLESQEIQRQPGCADLERSVRILFINKGLSPSQALHSLGHGTEGTSERGPIPYFSRYFPAFSGGDLAGRYDAGFESWYGFCQDFDQWPGTCAGSPAVCGCLSYGAPGAAQTVHYQKSNPEDGGVLATGDLSGYVPVCGNVHFPMNARNHYDVDNPAPVASTCEDYRLGSDGGTDAIRLIGSNRWRTLGGSGTDPEQGWQVYWRQNMPGPFSPVKDDDGRQMLWWAPFSYY